MVSKLNQKINELHHRGAISAKFHLILMQFSKNYIALSHCNGFKANVLESLFSTYLDLLLELHQNPFKFEPFHKQVITPFDYYQFGQDFTKPLIDQKASKCFGLEFVEKINQQVEYGENVILLGNHQTEIDPMVISILIEERFPQLARDMVFVAGDRVVSDELAIPMSMGRNLLCIYSKKHINHPPEETEQKRLHNKKTMKLMSELLMQGGKCIYVAPSGGRDRPNAHGVFEVSKFDPQSIEMFYLMTKKSKTTTHFYPLTLLTYRLLPPPDEVSSELGEERTAKHSAAFITFSSEVNMNNFPGHDHINKIKHRHNRSNYIWSCVHNEYKKLKKLQDHYEK